MIYLILFAADVLKGFFSRSGLPVALTDLVANSGFEPYLVLALMLLLLIILGCFMESLSMILVVIPFFWPTLIELNGGDYITAADAAFGMTADQLKIWFGVRSEEHTSELQSLAYLVCRLLLEKKKNKHKMYRHGRRALPC
mgnify:CR=1 FL=1